MKLSLPGNSEKSFKQLEEETGIHSATLHRAVGRAQDAGLLSSERKVYPSRLSDFLRYGVRHAFYVKRGGQTRGMATAYAAPPLKDLITPTTELPVWPDAQGGVRGFAVTPLHRDAPTAARKDPELYELLALVEALRIGNAREQKLATELLEARLTNVAAGVAP